MNIQHLILWSAAIVCIYLTPASAYAQTPNQSIEITLKKDGTSVRKTISGEKVIKVLNETEAATNIHLGSLKFDISKDGETLVFEDGPTNNLRLKIDTTKIIPQFASLRITDSKGKVILPPKTEGDTTKKDITPDYIFIPDNGQEAEYQKELCDTQECCEDLTVCPDDAEIVYDFRNKRACYFRDGKPKTLKKFHPRVDETLHLRIMNYHPYLDSIVVSKNFENRNQEYGPEFISLMRAGKPAEAESEQSKDTTAAAQSSTDVIQQFRNEMKQFYEAKIGKESSAGLTLVLLEKYVDYIQKNVLVQFKVSSSSPEAVRNSAVQMIETEPDANKRKALRKILEEGLRYYSLILQYNVVGNANFQIKNYDITSLTLENYKPKSAGAKEILTYEYFNRGGFKIDFSAGLFLHGLVDHRFTTIPTTGFDTTYTMGNPPVIDKITIVPKGRILRERSDDFTVSMGVISHAYSRWGKRVNTGFSLGIITDKREDDIRLKYLTGLSLLLGSEQRLVLSVGAIVGKANRLAEGLAEGDLVDPAAPGEAINIQTRELFCKSWFVGVSYNFGTVSPKKK